MKSVQYYNILRADVHNMVIREILEDKLFPCDPF